MDTPGIIVENITQVAATVGGDYIGVTLAYAGDQRVRLNFPTRMGSAVIGALAQGLSLAHREALKRLGSDQAVVDHHGTWGFTPSSYEIGYVVDDGVDLIMIMLKKDDVPLVNVHLSRDGARDLAARLIDAADMQEFPRRPRQ